MEKPSKPRSNKFLRCLIPHAASAVTFQNPPLSPRKAVSARGSSIPIISIIPPEVRRKPKTASFDAREPTSPKVSCMGHVKNTKKIKRKAKKVSVSSVLPVPQVTSRVSCLPKEVEGKKAQTKADVFYEKQRVWEAVPSLGKIKQFSSARGALSNFDWRTSGAVVAVPVCQLDGYISGPE